MMNWSEYKNFEIKDRIKKLENAACDCNMSLGHSCGFHKIANELRDEIVKELNSASQLNYIPKKDKNEIS